MHNGVIGAGALGLTVALRLAQRGHDVTDLEREVVPGGLAKPTTTVFVGERASPLDSAPVVLAFAA